MAAAPRTWPRVASILWFPVFFAIALPITFEVVYHQPKPRDVTVAVAGSDSQAAQLAAELDRAVTNGFTVRRLRSPGAAAGEVRSREVAAAYVAGEPGTLYLAPAATSIGASYLQGLFTTIADKSGSKPPRIVDVVPLRSGDGGNTTFFFVFTMMMIGIIAAIVLLQLPDWSIARRMTVVAATGAIGALTAYITATGLQALPGKPLLLLLAFALTQIYGQLMAGASPLLKQFFLPFSMTTALILSVPSSGGTVPTSFMPGFFHDLSYVMPLSQGVKIVRSVAYFHNHGLAQATIVLAAWALVAAAVLAVAWQRQSRLRRASS